MGKIETLESQVMAVGYFADASMEPVVRMADRKLRECLERDGLVPESTGDGSEDGVMFAQYDAIFSMGKRRGEVWIPLKDGGHPSMGSRPLLFNDKFREQDLGNHTKCIEL